MYFLNLVVKGIVLGFICVIVIMWSSVIRAENMEVCNLIKLLRKLHFFPPPHRRGFYICNLVPVFL